MESGMKKLLIPILIQPLTFIFMIDDGDGVADYFGYDDNDDWEVDRYEEA